MWKFIYEVCNRVIKNWKTSVVAILAAAVIVARWFGLVVTPEEILTILVGLEALVLLFAKD